jgi:hypothetical protein
MDITNATQAQAHGTRQNCIHTMIALVLVRLRQPQAQQPQPSEIIVLIPMEPDATAPAVK